MRHSRRIAARAAILAALIAIAGAQSARAQLTMQVGDGWSVTLAGNVNAFTVLTNGRVVVPGPIDGGRVPVERVTRIRTGLLPAIAVIDIKGHEAAIDLGVHFGVGAQINNATIHDNYDNGTQAGAQIDMRQVYLTIGGGWGQLLAGRELSLYQRENILNDMTLFGTGATGGGLGAGGTTLGRSGFGYIYPNFNAQVTFSTPPARSYQVSIGIFDPDFIHGDFSAEGAAPTELPRLEMETTWHGTAAGVPSRVWVSGMYQKADGTVHAAGTAAGVRLQLGPVAVVGSGYLATGVGSTYALTSNLGTDAVFAPRRSHGYVVQATFSRRGSAWTWGASYGASSVDQTGYDIASGRDDLLRRNDAVIGTVLLQATKSLRAAAEFTHAQAKAHSGATTRSDQVSIGLLLFF
ncbi:MAG: porin [Gemmatimonadales bacterium]|nr:porin [Gemmatimonadales bacterium]